MLFLKECMWTTCVPCALRDLKALCPQRQSYGYPYTGCGFSKLHMCPLKESEVFLNKQPVQPFLRF